jgi:hypothetical protein
MKTKVSQKEWNDKRDAFLCATLVHYQPMDFLTHGINWANKLTSELYEAEEENAETDKERWARFQRALYPEITESIEKAIAENENTMQTLDLGVHTPERQTKGEWVEPTDTRPFNPKVVEIFNEFLPKEIAPLAIEAHKRSCEIDKTYLDYGVTLEDCLMMSIKWLSTKKIGHFQSLYRRTKWNTITATPEQLREWFPQAYEHEGGENE